MAVEKGSQSVVVLDAVCFQRLSPLSVFQDTPA